MTLALDTDVLVAWTMQGSPKHGSVSKLLAEQLKHGNFGVTAQTLFEFLHVVSDPRRFEHPFTMDEAIRRARLVWDARDVVRITPGPTVMHRSLELMTTHRLGRKRILDTALAATLEGAGITRLATLNGRDFELFGFLEVVEPP